MSMDNLLYVNYKNMAEYQSKCYILKANIIEQNITIKDALKIWILNNLKSIFKTYLIIVNNQMQKNRKLEKVKVIFKTIEEKETSIVSK